MKMWIARDKDDSLWLFGEKPRLVYNDTWTITPNYDFYQVDDDFMPEVTFENSPQEIEIKLMKNYGK